MFTEIVLTIGTVNLGLRHESVNKLVPATLLLWALKEESGVYEYNEYILQTCGRGQYASMHVPRTSTFGQLLYRRSPKVLVLGMCIDAQMIYNQLTTVLFDLAGVGSTSE